MSFSQSIAACFSKFGTFDGRARRSEYWWFYLFTVLLSWGSSLVDGVGGTSPILNLVVSLVLLIPSLSAAARRLHDTDRSGWWMLIAFTIIGIIFLIIWLAREGQKQTNRFGNDPKAATS